MIQYGSDVITELKFVSFQPTIERRNNQLVDIELIPELWKGTPVPDGITELTVYVVCTVGGQIAQIVPYDEGIDCEFQFTVSEKEQISAYILSEDIQGRIRNLTSPI
ncbi:hypothetical protein DFQ01_11274 [Paenibacillus cellulosilyticus]|uniref:Uncharacterized protein n=1 Tax=Paenibacillus cellulosilyticus TaxID=375489 RepID=A0A2V2YSV8_9BACL|nr:hypothetical protein [Paenibacillus cellulosilyticus]PWW00721.1 hypothetical protein DFQ01_11274 [Paenibacillus cellulosilyticus]QKS45578.1 hypothetical protein HUB94_14930 [Paenibacillus cellulosilyticus]